MDSFNLQFLRVFIAVFVALFCGELSSNVKGGTILRLVNIGDNITLTCNPLKYPYNWNRWYKNRTELCNWNRVFVNDPRINTTYSPWERSSTHSEYNISISNVRIDDSATYKCTDYHSTEIQSYDVRVIGCSNCFVRQHTSEENLKAVYCTLDNFWVRKKLSWKITLRGDSYPTNRRAVIQWNEVRFNIHNDKLDKLRFKFYLNITTDSSITCMLSTPLPTSQPSIFYPTTTTKHNTLIQTSQNRLSTSIRTASQELSPATIPPVSNHTSLNKSTNTDNNGAGNIIIIAISGSIFILILIVLIVVLRCKQKKNHQENKHSGILSVDGKDTKEHPEACYESFDDGSQGGLRKSTSSDKMKDTVENQLSGDHHGRMVDNILYDSSDKIAEGSISRAEGPLDNALYAMPDKRKTLDRESKSGAIDGSSAADFLYGNSVIISQQEQKKDTLQRGGDQYENVEVQGSRGGGNAEEIPLYEMPDKVPQRNTLKATPKAGQTSTMSKEEVANVDALYAEVDKTKKK